MHSSHFSNPVQVTGEVSYNGYKLDEFVPQKTSAYISQYDLHMPEMTVRETIDFSARCQGVGSKAGYIPFVAYTSVIAVIMDIYQYELMFLLSCCVKIL